MKKIITKHAARISIAMLVLFVGGLLMACATMSLPDDAMPAERRAAMCFDARQGLALGQIGVSTAAGPEQVDYWQKWLTGARQAIELYCVEPML